MSQLAEPAVGTTRQAVPAPVREQGAVGQEPAPDFSVAALPAPGLPAPGLPATDFTDKEWAELHQQDKKAATIIVAIMIAIFATGLIMYTAISLVALSAQ